MEIIGVKSKVIEDMGLSMKAGPDSLIFTHCLPLCVSVGGRVLIIVQFSTLFLSVLIILLAFS